MSAPEMREVRPLFDTPASVGAFVQPGAGQVAEVTERTALLTKKEHDLLDVPTRPKAVHFRNMEERDFWILFLTIIFGNIVAFFDSTLMASAHPVITSYFNSSNSASWLSTSFQLALTVTQPLYSRVSDTIGRRPVFLFAQCMFLLATIGCALSPDIGTFILMRGLCGMGAGGVMSVSNVITSDVVKIEYRGIYQSYYNMAYGVGNGLGAALGGMLCDTLGWRWAFGVQVPWIFLFLLTSYFVTPDNLGPNLAKAQGKTILQAFESFDFRGSIVVTTTLTSLILGINLGGNVLSWTHPFVIVCLVLFVVGAFTIIPISRRAQRPVLPLHLLAKSPNSNLMWASLCFSVCLNLVLFNVPLFLQAVRQCTPTVSGLYMIVPLVGVGLTSCFTGYFIAVTRLMQPQIYIGQILLVLGIIGTICLNQHMPSWAILLLAPWAQIGQGFYFPTTTIATLSLNTLDDQAVVVSTLGLFRSIGNIMGVACSSWILQNSLPVYLERLVKDEDASLKEKIVQEVRRSVDAIRSLDPVHKAQVVSAYAKAMRITFASGAIFAFLVVVLSWGVNLPKLRGEDDISDIDDEGSDTEIEVFFSGEEATGALFYDDEVAMVVGEEDKQLRRHASEQRIGKSLNRKSSRRMSRTSSGGRRTSELRMGKEESLQTLQLGRRASFDMLV